MQIVVLSPVLDDWVSARELLIRLDGALAAGTDTVSVLLVDDGSSEKTPAGFGAGPFKNLREVSILRLKKNLGHQRALAVGLCHINEKIACDAVVVMDSDGEDEAPDAARLVDALRESAKRTDAKPSIIFAERRRRSESPAFQLGYLGYRILHYTLTGRGIRFGNFSIIPRERLTGLTVEPMIWNHYAAAVVASYQHYETIPTHRGQRFAGRSHFGFVKLVIHGLSALSCYSEIIGVRLLLLASLFFLMSLAGIAIVLALHFATQIPIPGWTSIFAGLLCIFLLQVITLATTYTMQIISTRTTQPFLPARDYAWYIARVDPCQP